MHDTRTHVFGQGSTNVSELFARNLHVDEVYINKYHHDT